MGRRIYFLRECVEEEHNTFNYVIGVYSSWLRAKIKASTFCNCRKKRMDILSFKLNEDVIGMFAIEEAQGQRIKD